MIPRSHRLPALQIVKLVRGAHRHYSASLVLFWRASAYPRARIAIMVSRKVNTRATVRNLLRRRIAQICMTNTEKIGSRDIVISTKKAATFDVYEKEILQWLGALR